jgi:hypothetical protein
MSIDYDIINTIKRNRKNGSIKMSYKSTTLAAAFGAALLAAPVMAQEAQPMTIAPAVEGTGTITITVDVSNPYYAESDNGVLETATDSNVPFDSMEECLGAAQEVVSYIQSEFELAEIMLSLSTGQDLTNTFGVEATIECTDKATNEVQTSTAKRNSMQPRP